jgi:hypothetical protein
MSPEEALQLVLDKLEGSEIEYMLTGGLALRSFQWVAGYKSSPPR